LCDLTQTVATDVSFTLEAVPPAPTILMRVDIRHLRPLIAVADCGSYHSGMPQRVEKLSVRNRLESLALS
jgi:hypothetical protein